MQKSGPIWNERWRLAVLRPSTLARIAMISLVIGLIFFIFHFQGNTTDVGTFDRSVLKWTTALWQLEEGETSHGWLIPLVSLFMVWYHRRALRDAPKKTSWAGLGVFVLALLLHWLGAKAQQTRLSLFALILMTWGIPFYLFGWPTAKILMFPCAYLIFCIPMNFLDTLTFPLRIVMTILTTGILNGIGLQAVRSGTAIHCESVGFDFDVADPCSGLRSLLAMTAITAAYAYFTQRTWWRKWLLFLCSIPLAIVGNLMRILTIALVAGSIGQKVATGIYHDYSSYIFFPIAIALMLAVGHALNLDYRKEWTIWKQKLLSPIS